MTPHITFIGGGNMASAIIGGLLRRGMTPQQIDVVEPFAEARDKLLSQFGINALHGPGPALAKASLVVWAVKPQTFKEAALQARFHTRQALHLSVAAGIRSDSIASWLGTQRIVRAMPNTPALVGKGMTALFGRPAVTDADRDLVNRVLTPTGRFLWVTDETQLDAVTALSGSGPAYVFYFLLGDWLAEPEFFARILTGQRTHLLLDLHNVFTMAQNVGADPYEYLRRLDLAEGRGGFGHRVADDHAGAQAQRQVHSVPLRAGFHRECAAGDYA